MLNFVYHPNGEEVSGSKAECLFCLLMRFPKLWVLSTCVLWCINNFHLTQVIALLECYCGVYLSFMLLKDTSFLSCFVFMYFNSSIALVIKLFFNHLPELLILYVYSEWSLFQLARQLWTYYCMLYSLLRSNFIFLELWTPYPWWLFFDNVYIF